MKSYKMKCYITLSIRKLIDMDLNATIQLMRQSDYALQYRFNIKQNLVEISKQCHRIDDFSQNPWESKQIFFKKQKRADNTNGCTNDIH